MQVSEVNGTRRLRGKTASLLLVAIVVAALTGCGGAKSDDATTTPSGGNAGTTTTVAGESGAAQLPAGFSLGTPQSQDPIEKDVPTQAANVPPPTPRSSSFDSDGDGYLTEPELMEALQATYPSYHWPPGYVLDLDVVTSAIAKNSQTATSHFENGAERTILGTPYLCAWQYALLDAMTAANDQGVSTAIAQLRAELAGNPMFSEVRQGEEDAIDKAELGDPAPLQLMIQMKGCAKVVWVSGTPTSGSPPAAFAPAGASRPPDAFARRWNEERN